MLIVANTHLHEQEIHGSVWYGVNVAPALLSSHGSRRLSRDDDWARKPRRVVRGLLGEMKKRVYELAVVLGFAESEATVVVCSGRRSGEKKNRRIQNKTNCHGLSLSLSPSLSLSAPPLFALRRPEPSIF